MTKHDKAAPTSAAILEKLASLDDALADLEADFDRHAAAAVAGEPDAGRKAAETNARIERMGVDRLILTRALAKARQREAVAHEAEREAERTRHRMLARERATNLLDAARHADDAITALLAAFDDLGRIEADTRACARAAGISGIASIRGRANIVVHAHECLKRRQSPYALRPDERDRVADIASEGWAFLLDDETETEAA